jgi:hypothetical protein
MIGAPDSPFYAPSRWEGAVIGLGALLAYFVFAYVLGEGRGTIVGAFVCSFALAVRISWPLTRRVWFWFAIGVLAALHVATMAFVDWSFAAQWTGLTFMPFAAADTALLLVIIYFVFRSVYGAPDRLVTTPEPRYEEDAE